MFIFEKRIAVPCEMIICAVEICLLRRVCFRI